MVRLFEVEHLQGPLASMQRNQTLLANLLVKRTSASFAGLSAYRARRPHNRLSAQSSK